MLKKELWVGKKIGRGGGGGKFVILSTSTYTQIPKNPKKISGSKNNFLNNLNIFRISIIIILHRIVQIIIEESGKASRSTKSLDMFSNP